MSSNINAGRDSSGGFPGDPSNKRTAHAGQWRTPPLPVFPASYPQHQPGQNPSTTHPNRVVEQPVAQQSQFHPHAALPNPSNIPANSEDYAKALQEAYRKGAEAAARMAQQIPTTASCPNFSTGSPHTPAQSSSVGVSVEEAAYSHHVQHPQPTHPSIPDPLSSSMPPPPPAPTQLHVSGQHPPVQHHIHHVHHQHAPTTAQHPPSSDYAATAATSKPSQGRSLSLPDMSAYAAQAEEEKRQKRLARNRASARLRRLRKKNLVDAYETEVGILEKTLKQLKAHEWGKNDDHKALLDALCMERGQQAIGQDQRTSIIQDIMKQQMQQVELLRQAQLEQDCLAQLALNENDDLSKELQELLQLTDAQKNNLKIASEGLDEEVGALETVATSLQAMLDNDWLLNEGVQNITEQFTSIMHKNQLSKFLLWTDANVEAIDQLDHVDVRPLQGAPIFSFGVESTPGDEDEKS